MWYIAMVVSPWLPTHPKAAAACIGGHCSGQPEPGPGGAGRMAGTWVEQQTSNLDTFESWKQS